jgi:hypothetical protein
MKRMLFFLLAAMLTACGGDDNPPAAPAPTPPTVPAPPPPAPGATPAPTAAPAAWEGVFAGQTGDSEKITVLRLGDGSIFGIVVSPHLGAVGYVEATDLRSNGSAIEGDAVILRENYGRIAPGTISATQVGEVFSATVTAATAAISFNAVRMKGSDGYDYSRPASFDDVVGAWSWSTKWPSGRTVAVAVVGVSANGQMWGDLYGCPFTGNATPRTDGRNVFEVRITYGSASTCDYPGGAHAGVGIATTIDGQRSFMFSVRDANKLDAMTFAGVR